MSFDTPTLIWCVLVPGCIALFGALSSCWLGKRAPNESAFASELALAASFWLAITVSMFGKEHLDFNSFPLWSEEAWPTIVWPLLLGIGLVSPRATNFLGQGALWILLAVVAVLGAATVMPTGEGWTDVMPLHRTWIPGITCAAIVNSYLLHRSADQGATRWLPLIILAGLACAAIVGASAYGALFETCVAAIAAVAIIAVFAALGWLSTPHAIVFTSMLFAASMIAGGRFYSYADVPAFAYLIALFAPGLIAASDLFVLRRATWLRVGIAAIVAVSVVSTVAYCFLVA